MLKEWIVSSGIYGKVLKRFCKLTRCEGVTFSQNGEDLIIDMLIPDKKGTYVDVGAHHPIRFSNTFQLYLKGWSGINIDPSPDCMKEFKKYRPGDVNLNVGVSDHPGRIGYYCFSESAYNTTSAKRAKHLLKNKMTELKGKKQVRVVRLKSIFDRYLKNRKIDVLNIDVETMELDVLQSNDWEAYRPRLIVMESILSCYNGVETIKEDPAIRYLLGRGYVVIAKARTTVFLMAEEEIQKDRLPVL